MSKKRKTAPSAEESRSQSHVETVNKRQKLVDEGDVDTELEINISFSTMDSQLLADYLSRRTMTFESNLSLIELSDKHVSAQSILDTSPWEKPRTLEHLPEFLENFFGTGPDGVRSVPTKNGSPHTIVIAGAGLRAANLARVVRKCQDSNVVVAKLFAKHIKRKDAVKFLQNTKSGVAVGTPTRLNDLIDDEALNVDGLKRIIVDASHIDAKKRGILDMKETYSPLIQFLNRKEFKHRYGSGDKKIDIIFY